MKNLWGALVLATSSALFSCTSLGSYTWFGDVPQAEWSSAPGEYVIGVGDIVNIRVYDQDNLTTRGKIRSDGRIALPLVGEFLAAGKTPLILGKEVASRLAQFIVNPRVTVNVDETVPIIISVVGEVTNRGSFSIDQPATLLQAIAKAGGLTDFANKDAIFVMRQKPVFRRIRFTYDALLTSQGNAASFPVRAGDVIVVQ